MFTINFFVPVLLVPRLSKQRLEVSANLPKDSVVSVPNVPIVNFVP